MFASKSLTEHLARGGLGLGTLLAAMLCAPNHPWLALAALPIGLVALRGCPSCWLLGLLAQIVLLRSAKGDVCVAGRCAERRPSQR